MRWIAVTCLGLLISTGANAQMGMPGGGGGGGGSGSGGGPGGRGDRAGPPGGSEQGKPSAPRPPKPLKREKFDKAVTAMFRTADTNRDGTVTPDELRAVIDGRREAVVRARFARIDHNKNGSIDFEEFATWQRSMGSASSSETAAVGERDYIADDIKPEAGNGPDDRILARLIEPLSATVLVNANVSYHAGVTLDELLAYERKRFDAADVNHDGEISMDEAREENGGDVGRGADRGGRAGGPRPPPR